MRRPSVVLAIAITLLGLPARADGDSWVNAVQTQLNAAKVYPRSAQVRGETGVAVMQITVDGNGMITGYQRLHSSGSDILDREAEKTLDKIGQLPPPADRKGRTFQISLRWDK